MNSISVKLDRDITELELIPISDTHIGDPSVNEQKVAELIRYVDDHPNTYALLNGDLMNNAIKSSKSDTYTEYLSPMEQMVKLVNMIRPISHKILAVTQGNHERRTWKESGVDITRLMCRELGLEDKYAEGMAYIFLRFGETNGKNHNRQQRYTILITHGSGGGKSVGSKANRLADLVSIADADIYIYGHTHQTIAFKEGFIRVDPCSDSVRDVDRLFVNSGAYMQWGGYAEQNQYRPSVIVTPHIILSGTDRKMTVTF